MARELRKRLPARMRLTKAASASMRTPEKIMRASRTSRADTPESSFQ